MNAHLAAIVARPLQEEIAYGSGDEIYDAVVDTGFERLSRRTDSHGAWASSP